MGDLYTIADKLSKKPTLLNQGDDHGYTALHFAAQNGHVSIVQFLLLKAHCDVNAQQCGATPLHRAAFSGQLECVRLLVEAGANLNLPDTSFGDDNTALHKAVLGGHQDVYDYLLEKGADASLTNRKGRTAQDLLMDPCSKNSDVSPNESPGDEPVSNNNNVISPDNMSEEQESNLLKSTLESVQVVLPQVKCAHCGQSALSFARTKSKQLICTKCKDANPSLIRNL